MLKPEMIEQTIERLERGEALTLGKSYGVAMEVQDEGTASRFLAALVVNLMKRQPGRTYEEVDGIVRQNVGYWTGYYGPEVAPRVFRLFHCKHPIF